LASYLLSRGFATMPSRSSAHASRNRSTPRRSTCAAVTDPAAARNEARENLLAADEWQHPQVAAVEPQDVERHVVRLRATGAQFLELRLAAVRPEAADLAVEHRSPGGA
jgi:hypothetical protein